MRHYNCSCRLAALALASASVLFAGPADRVTGRIDASRVHVLPGSVHRLATPQSDRGAVDPTMRMESMMLLVKPSAAQQAELNQLLADQQNPSSPQFRKWLTPEAFGARFGLTTGDHSKVVAWLSSQGFEVKESGRARNWVMFSGTAGQVENALHTQIHRYEVNGEKHFANATPVAVPEVLVDMVGGVTGLHDFQAKSGVRKETPKFNSGTSHFLVPEDFATIYDVMPIASAGIDGTGVNIGIIGFSQLQVSDIEMFQTKYNLPVKDPKSVVVGTNPGVVLAGNDLLEADLDIEWSGAIAPGAQVYYYYSSSYPAAIASAVNANLVHMISMSFGYSELDNPTLSLQPVLQQANAQGITLFVSTGDSGAATAPDSSLFSRFGAVVSTPASFPEVTAVGGTQFNDTTNASTYWATTNDANSGSALSYIPEIAWSGGGGGASVVFPKPVWQVAPGVPQDGARDLPDVSLSASAHDGYEIVYLGIGTSVGGTSASTPSMAGIVALLNHYLVANGQIAKPGLGNINPQLYRMAQTVPNAFHDITSGGNTDSCVDGSPGCATGTIGYTAGPGYDLATGIGTIDVNNFITQWTSATNAVNVTFAVNPATGTYNDTFQMSATVAPVSGAGTPTGVVDFANASVHLGSATLDASSGQAIATLTVPGYLFTSATTYTLTAQYGGDTAFSGGGATAQLKITAPTGVSAIVPSIPVSVTATTDPTGLVWGFTMSLLERGGVPSILTGVNLDGQDQPVSQFFPQPSIPALGSIASTRIIFRNLAYPLARTFIFSGMDATGQSWTRQVSITFLGPNTNTQSVLLTAVPLVMQQNPAADPSCQWSQQLIITENSGYPETISTLALGNIAISNQIPAIFGTAQLAAYGSLQGTICWTGQTAGATDTVTLVFSSGLGAEVAVSFAGQAANPSPVSVSPSSLSLSPANIQGSFNISVPDGQSWTIGTNPQNVRSGWLSLSQTSGTGSAQITVSANGSGFAPDAYLANLIIQGPNLSPASITVPVTFINGTGVTITSLTNSASGGTVAAPGMLAVLQGTNLASSSVNFGFYAFSPSFLSITVNGVPAAFLSASSTQIRFQIPYEISPGTAVVGVSYKGNVGGYNFQVAPSAPGIFVNAAGSAGTVQAGKSIALTMTGDGVMSPTIGDGSTPSTLSSLAFKTALPFTLTIGGTPAFLNSYGIVSGAYNTTLNVLIPVSTPAGVQPVVVTVNGVPSPPVNLTITAAP